MQCPTSVKLAEYQHEALASREHEAVHLHVAQCAACQRELHALARAVRLLESAPAPVLPDNLWAGVANRLPANRRIAFRQRWWKVLAGAGAVAGVAMGLCVMHVPHPMLPIAPATSSPYVAEHALLSTQDTFADRASIGAMLAAQRGEP